MFFRRGNWLACFFDQLKGLHVPSDDRMLGIIGLFVPDKTRVLRSGSCQRVTGLVTNHTAEGPRLARVSRQMRRNLRAAIHNLQQGKELHPGETLDTLRGTAAYISMTDPELGHKLLTQIETIAASQSP